MEQRQEVNEFSEEEINSAVQHDEKFEIVRGSRNNLSKSKLRANRNISAEEGESSKNPDGENPKSSTTKSRKALVIGPNPKKKSVKEPILSDANAPKPNVVETSDNNTETSSNSYNSFGSFTKIKTIFGKELRKSSGLQNPQLTSYNAPDSTIRAKPELKGDTSNPPIPMTDLATWTNIKKSMETRSGEKADEEQRQVSSGHVDAVDTPDADDIRFQGRVQHNSEIQYKNKKSTGTKLKNLDFYTKTNIRSKSRPEKTHKSLEPEKLRNSRISDSGRVGPNRQYKTHSDIEYPKARRKPLVSNVRDHLFYGRFVNIGRKSYDPYAALRAKRFRVLGWTKRKTKPSNASLEKRRRSLSITSVNQFGVSTKVENQSLLEIYEQPEFSDSDSERWMSPEHYENQLDDEWLEVDEEYKSENIKSDIPNAKIRFEHPNPTLDPGCKEFMTSMKYFWWGLMIGGRMPFQTYIEDRVIKFRMNRYSYTFFYFLLSTAFLTFCTTTMGLTALRSLIASRSSKVFQNYERVERLEMEKYWYYAFLTFIPSVMASSWSLAIIFEDGNILADFLTRWNVAISVMKYRPVARIRYYFWVNTCVFIIYAAIVILLFNSEEVPVVRGASGIIGLAICYPFSHEIRYSRNYSLVEKLGLFIHLYVVFSSRAILVMVTLYCKVLVNMARKWNLRLAHVLGRLTNDVQHGNIISVIPYQKLFTEHTIIVTFLRHIGRVFTVALGIFYTLKMFELLLLIYRVGSVFIYKMPNFNGTHVEGTPDYLTPITYIDPPFVLILTSILILLHSVAEWFIITDQISYCGDAILNGYSYVRRFGVILSKTSARRRFVQSLNHAFSHATDYYVLVGFRINRQFTFDTFFWLGVFGSLLTAFNPFRLENDIC